MINHRCHGGWRTTAWGLLALALLPLGGPLEADEPTRGNAAVRIVLVGDSTVTDHAGWGAGFKRFLTDAAVCINTAQGGRSSKSFLAEGRWSRALAEKGDYYLIQFGHNDEPGKGPDRETDPDTTFIANMARYVDEARAAGAVPILVTPLTRRNFDRENPGKIKSSLERYAQAVRRLAKEKNVPLIDLHARSIELCERTGPAGVAKWNPPKPGGADMTHLDAEGSVIFARLVMEDLRAVAPALAPCLRAEPAAANAAPAKEKIGAIVAFDGSGNYATVQAAVDAAPAGRTEPYVILIKPGRYREHVLVPENKPCLTLRGEGAPEETVITFDTDVNATGADGKKLGTPASSTVLARAANFTAENLTFENTTSLERKVQGLAMYVTSDRAAFRHCRFLGWQDTLRADAPRPDGTQPDVQRPGGNARQYFADCYIEGYVDFIYAAATAVFDRCHIHCKGNGWITAASTPADVPFGYVFLDCRITAAPGVSEVRLGRPWRRHAAVAFVRTEMPSAIRPEGWSNWNNPENEKTARFSEYRSRGPGARPAERVAWSRQLSDGEAATMTAERILGGPDHWNPKGP